jgi:hypothetical protein
MIAGAAYMAFSVGRRKRSVLSVIQSLGLAANLKLCLDAGDVASYGSGQTWADRSGGATDFYLGTGSGSDAADPTFNGVAGGLSKNEYWSFDGGDIFSLVAASNPAWAQTFHKNNALLTIMTAFYSASSSDETICATGSQSSLIGFAFLRRGTAPNHITFTTTTTSGTTVLNATSSSANAPGSAWNIIGVSVDEAAGASGGTFFANGTTETFNATYASPSASSAGANLAISSWGGVSTSGAFKSGSRLAWLAAWDAALTASQMQQIYSAMQGRLGI